MKNKYKLFQIWFNKKFGWFLNPSTKQGKEKQNSIYK